MKQNSSSRRVNEQAREVIASILLFDISDPRLRRVTITGCEVSFDRSACNVFYTTDRDSYEDAAEAFEKASGRIRSLMSRRLSWRVAPSLRFILDASVDEAERIANALAREDRRMLDSQRAQAGELAASGEQAAGADAPSAAQADVADAASAKEAETLTQGAGAC